MRGKLIVIEGTDCSGKETQSNKLIDCLRDNGFKVEKISFPNYDTPSGKIVGGPYLGKSSICDGWFEEGAPNVDAKISSLYFAADRRYSMPKINNYLNDGINVILDRYTYSNMAHQGGKIEDKNKRLQMFKWLEELEFNLCNLPIPDIRIFLHMPYEGTCILKQNRSEAPDQLEKDQKHLQHAEKAYLEIANLYSFKTIECMEEKRIKTIDEISNDLCKYVIDSLKK